MVSWRLSLVTIWMLATTPLAGVGGEKDVADPPWFEKHIRPVLATQCLKCHGQQKQEGNLRLDSLAALVEGGDSGPAIVPGDAGETGERQEAQSMRGRARENAERTPGIDELGAALETGVQHRRRDLPGV